LLDQPTSRNQFPEAPSIEAKSSPAESRSKSKDAAADLVARTERIAILDTRGGKISAPRRSILKRAPAPDVWVAPVLLAEVGKPSA
jgi:hypothetical protein